MEFKTYVEIDLEESPIVVLGCGHFFTGETLDGLVGLGEVYTVDKEGKFDGLKDVSGSLSRNVPFCACKRPIRQFATKRYNRLINRAVMDEICKRFLITGHEILDDLETRLSTEEDKLEDDRDNRDEVPPMKGRYKELEALQRYCKGLARRMGEDHQPTKVLIDAIATSRSKTTGDPLSITRQMEALKLAPPAPDSQIVLGAQLVEIQSQELRLQDAISIIRQLGQTLIVKQWLKEQRLPSMPKFLDTCKRFIEQAKQSNLPRNVVAATLAFARVSQLFVWHAQSHEQGQVPKSEEKEFANVEQRTNTARELLEDALNQCSRFEESEELQECVEEMLELFQTRYNRVTPEELASIKTAMVSGRGGFSSHSGHWYRCVNGHPVSSFNLLDTQQCVG